MAIEASNGIHLGTSKTNTDLGSASSVASSSGASLVAASGYKFKDHGSNGGKKLKLKKLPDPARQASKTNGTRDASDYSISD